MHSYKTTGIVLKSSNLGEADKILTIFTERFGKIKAMAKGVRKIKSKLAGSLEPFMLIDLQLHEGKTFYIVTGAVIIEELNELHSDLHRTSLCFYLGELIDKFTNEGEKNTEVFGLFNNTLGKINERDNPLFLRAFELKLLDLSGFHPELYDCVHCKNRIMPGVNHWDPVEGGLICPGCQLKTSHGMAISENLIKLLRFFKQNDLDRVDKLKADKELLAESERILGNYISHVLEWDLKSKRFLEMV